MGIKDMSCIVMNLTDNRVNHFDKFGVAHIPEGIYLFTG